MPEYSQRMREAEEAEGRPLREVLEERYRTETMQEIAEHFGVSTGTVSNWFFRLGIPTPATKRHRAQAGDAA